MVMVIGTKNQLYWIILINTIFLKCFASNAERNLKGKQYYVQETKHVYIAQYLVFLIIFTILKFNIYVFILTC